MPPYPSQISLAKQGLAPNHYQAYIQTVCRGDIQLKLEYNAIPWSQSFPSSPLAERLLDVVDRRLPERQVGVVYTFVRVRPCERLHEGGENHCEITYFKIE